MGLDRVMPTQFGYTRCEVDHHVGVFIEGSADPVQLFRVVPEMNTHESSLGMSSDDLAECLEKFHPRWIFVGIPEPPTFVVPQFLPALIFLVVRQPESPGISHMDGHRQVEFATPLPNRVQLRIIHAQQLASTIAEE